MWERHAGLYNQLWFDSWLFRENVNRLGNFSQPPVFLICTMVSAPCLARATGRHERTL